MFTIIRGGRYGRVGAVRAGVQGGTSRRLPPGAVGREAAGEGHRVLRPWINEFKHVGRLVARAVARILGGTGTVSLV